MMPQKASIDELIPPTRERRPQEENTLYRLAMCARMIPTLLRGSPFNGLATTRPGGRGVFAHTDSSRQIGLIFRVSPARRGRATPKISRSGFTTPVCKR
jgi:hypothetical protein